MPLTVAIVLACSPTQSGSAHRIEVDNFIWSPPNAVQAYTCNPDDLGERLLGEFHPYQAASYQIIRHHCVASQIPRVTRSVNCLSPKLRNETVSSILHDPPTGRA